MLDSRKANNTFSKLCIPNVLFFDAKQEYQVYYKCFNFNQYLLSIGWYLSYWGN